MTSDAETLKKEVDRLHGELKLNASILAKQTDMAREAERTRRRFWRMVYDLYPETRSGTWQFNRNSLTVTESTK